MGLPPFPVTIAPVVGHLVTICSRFSSNLLLKEWLVRNNLNPTELSKHLFWMVGFDNVDALYTAIEKANRIKWMTVSGIMVLVSHHLQLKTSNDNIFIILKKLQFLMKTIHHMRPQAIKRFTDHLQVFKRRAVNPRIYQIIAHGISFV